MRRKFRDQVVPHRTFSVGSPAVGLRALGLVAPSDRCHPVALGVPSYFPHEESTVRSQIPGLAQLSSMVSPSGVKYT